MTDGLIATLLAFFVVTVSPGPANIAVAAVSAGQGRRKGLLFAFGLTVGLAFWGVIAATGVGAVLHTASHALVVLKVIGGVYLLWLAVQSARSVTAPKGEGDLDTGRGLWFWRGLMLNLSNPKAVIAWMAALSMGLGVDAGPTMLVFTTGACMALGAVNYGGYALVFSAPGAMKAYRRTRRWIDGTVAFLFAGAGLGLLRSALARS